MLLPFAALLRPTAYFRRVRTEAPSWTVTAAIVLLPWFAVCTAGQVLGLTVFPPDLPSEGVPTLPAYGVYSWAVISSYAVGVGCVAGLLGEAFDGRIDVDAAVAAVAAAALPAGVAKLLWPIPGLQWLGLPLLVWGLWMLYRGLGDVLGIPSGRLSHCFVSLLAALLVAVAVGWQLRDLIPGAAPAVRMGRLWLI